MSVPRTLLPLSLIVLALGAAAASAQTVVVQNAPPGSTVELVLDGAAAGAATAGADGVARLTANAALAQPSLNVFVWVDECETVRRVILMPSTAAPPPAGANCRRAQVQGQFLLQPVTSMLVNVGASSPRLRLRQGPMPPEWLLPPAQAAAARFFAVPNGLMVSGAGGFGAGNGFTDQACGDVTGCSGDGPRPLAGAATIWFSPFIGIEGGFSRPGRLTAEGSGTRFDFDSDLDGGVVTVVGKVGGPVGRVRIYGLGGAAWHRATFTTRQTFEETTLPGGAQTYQWRTEGWGLTYGGGTEVWFNSRLALFGEGARVEMKGDDVGRGDAELDVSVTSVVIGVRVRLLGG